MLAIVTTTISVFVKVRVENSPPYPNPDFRGKMQFLDLVLFLVKYPNIGKNKNLTFGHI
mgnify:CR=1 FL=1